MFAHLRVLIVALMTAGPAFAQTPAAAPDRPVKMVVLGDSLSAGLGLSATAAFPVRLQKALNDKWIKVDMINAGVSGDTSSGGRDRLDWSIPEGTEAVILELGANDALRGVPLATTEANLRTIVEQSQAAHAKVLLIGMYVPPNYGPDYSQKFHGVYEELSKEKKVPLVPFLLAGIENKPAMFQADQIHPTVQAQPLLLDNVWPNLKPLLGAAASK